jgi:SNF2 family DNA or RNA helicase
VYAELAPVLNHPGCLKVSQGGFGKNVRWKTEAGDEHCWLKEGLNGLDYEKLEHAKTSPKFIALAHILASAFETNERVLVYSKCLKTLDLIELFINSSFDEWKKQVSSLRGAFSKLKFRGLRSDVDYLRIQGSVDSGKRASFVNQFNKIDNSIKLFLISSEAGGIGINLVRIRTIHWWFDGVRFCHEFLMPTMRFISFLMFCS